MGCIQEMLTRNIDRTSYCMFIDFGMVCKRKLQTPSKLSINGIINHTLTYRYDLDYSTFDYSYIDFNVALNQYGDVIFVTFNDIIRTVKDNIFKFSMEVWNRQKNKTNYVTLVYNHMSLESVIDNNVVYTDLDKYLKSEYGFKRESFHIDADTSVGIHLYNPMKIFDFIKYINSEFYNKVFNTNEILLNSDIDPEFARIIELDRTNIQRSYNYELLTLESLRTFSDTFDLKNKRCIELGAGHGLLTKFLNKYHDVSCIAIDDKSWENSLLYPKDIVRIDSLDAVEKYAKDTDIFIMSWVPAFDIIDIKCYKKMKEINPNCKMIVIGEIGECCGSYDIKEKLVERFDIFQPFSKYINSYVGLTD